jgi:hypothetical protein
MHTYRIEPEHKFETSELDDEIVRLTRKLEQLRGLSGPETSSKASKSDGGGKSRGFGANMKHTGAKGSKHDNNAGVKSEIEGDGWDLGSVGKMSRKAAAAARESMALFSSDESEANGDGIMNKSRKKAKKARHGKKDQLSGLSDEDQVDDLSAEGTDKNTRGIVKRFAGNRHDRIARKPEKASHDSAASGSDFDEYDGAQNGADVLQNFSEEWDAVCEEMEEAMHGDDGDARGASRPSATLGQGHAGVKRPGIRFPRVHDVGDNATSTEVDAGSTRGESGAIHSSPATCNATEASAAGESCSGGNQSQAGVASGHRVDSNATKRVQLDMGVWSSGSAAQKLFGYVPRCEMYVCAQPRKCVHIRSACKSATIMFARLYIHI